MKKQTHHILFPPDPTDKAIDDYAAKLWKERVKGGKRDTTIRDLKKKLLESQQRIRELESAHAP